MLGTLLHGGDLSGGAWAFILLVVALAGAAVLAAFVGILYLINKRTAAPEASATPAGGRRAERIPYD